jgi:hypothetical protein
MGSGVPSLHNLDFDAGARKTPYKSNGRHVYSVIVSSSPGDAATAADLAPLDGFG